MPQTSPKIVIYVKTFCGWSEGVRATLRKYHLAYEEKDVVKNPAFRWEMEQRSGQPLHRLIHLGVEHRASRLGHRPILWVV